METKTKKVWEGIQRAIREKRIVIEGIKAGKTRAEMEKDGVVFADVSHILKTVDE